MCAGVYSSPRLLFYTGLRGAIAFALAIRNTSTEPRQIMVSATMMIVIVTVILGGGLTTPMLGWLQIRSALIRSHSYQWYRLDWNKKIYQMKWWNIGFEDIKVKLLESILIDCFVRFLGIYKMWVIQRLLYLGLYSFCFWYYRVGVEEEKEMTNFAGSSAVSSLVIVSAPHK